MTGPARRQAAVTVAIATLDRPAGLGRCLDALLDADVRPAEVLVVDQGASVATPAIVDGRRASGVPIVYLAQARLGLSASRNAALERAAQPVLAVTDDDCVPDPRWLAVIDGWMTHADPPDAVTGRVLPLGPAAPGTYALSTRESLARGDYQRRTAPWLVGTGANLAVRCEAIERVGAWDERLGAGSRGGAGEDLDVFHRLLGAGARIVYDPAAVVYHERAPWSRRMATRRSYGRGVGACCGLWLREGDAYALAILGRWLLLRGSLAARAAATLRWRGLLEEGRMLAGTIEGLAYALGSAGPSRRSLTPGRAA